MKVPAIYAMIHFVEKTWGIHYAKGGTGALVAGLVKKFEDMGGRLRLHAPVQRILVEDGVAKGVELVSGEKIELN
jgi:phytoene desaturase